MSTAMQLSTAMLEAYKKGLGVDYSLICQGVVKKVHSQVWPLESELIRSSLFEALLTYPSGDHGQVWVHGGEGE